MLPWLVVSALLGLILLFAESLMSGFGLLGILGILVTACVFIISTFLYGTGGLVIAALLFAISLVLLIKGAALFGLHKKALLDARNERHVGERYIGDMIGRSGVAEVDLKPYGIVSVDGMEIEAYAAEGFVKKGLPVQIVQSLDGRIVVKAE